MRNVDWEILPDKVQYKKNEPVLLKVIAGEGVFSVGQTVKVTIFHYQKVIWSEEKEAAREMTFSFNAEESREDLTGWLVEAECWQNGVKLDCRYSAFDCVDSWNCVPRYGFLADFTQGDCGTTEDMEFIRRMHLNVIQFYDWMYRHDDYFPEEENFVDIMGKPGSMRAVKEKIDQMHAIGSKAIAYGAVYGAENFQNEHPECQYLHADGTPMMFIDRIALMDINQESAWHEHILQEYQRAVDFGFDGIHMDQYGEPKVVMVQRNGESKLRYLRDDFVKLIDDARSKLPDAGLIFNAVNNWPTGSVAYSGQDCIYIEVWSPNDTYRDLYRLVKTSKAYEPQKQVILAAYLEPFFTNPEKAEIGCTAQLAMATICSCGGFHLLMGEAGGLLTKAYYVDYHRIETKAFYEVIKSYYDFITAYGELLFSSRWWDETGTCNGGINTEICLKGAVCTVEPEKNSIWVQVKQSISGYLLQMVNYSGLENDRWNDLHEQMPEVAENLEVQMKIPGELSGIWMASPDENGGKMKELSWDKQYSAEGDQIISFIVPEVKIWSIIYVERN